MDIQVGDRVTYKNIDTEKISKIVVGRRSR